MCLHAQVRRLRHRELSSLELRELDYKVSDGQPQDQKVERTLEASARLRSLACTPLLGTCAVLAALLVHTLTAEACLQDLYVQSEESRLSQPAGSLL